MSSPGYYVGVLPPKKRTRKQLITALEKLIEVGQQHEHGIMSALPHGDDYRAGFTEVRIPFGLLIHAVKLLKKDSYCDPTRTTRKNGKR